MRTVAVTCLLALCSTAGAKSNNVRVLGIAFEGNRAVPTAALTRVLPIRRGQQIPAVVVEAALSRQFVEAAVVEPVSRLYYRLGFVTHQLTPQSVQLVRRKRGVLVKVKLSEGPRFKMGKLHGGSGRHRRSLGLKRGRTFDGVELTRGVDRITRRLRDQGYAAAEVKPQLTLDAERKTIHVQLRVDRGALFAVEKIELQGNRKIHARLIRGALDFAEGDRYSERALKRSWERLMATGFFKSVDLSLSKGEKESGLVITVTSTERANCPSLDAA